MLLKIGEEAAVPPAGWKRLKLDSDGVPVLIDEGGAAEDVGGAVGGNGEWASAQYDFIHDLMPTLTRFQYLKAGQVPQGGAVPSTSDGAVEGGGRTSANATFAYLTASVFQAANTGVGAMAFRARFLAASAGQTNAVGLANADASHDLLIGAIASISTANYGLAADGTASTTDDLAVANDLGFHTFVVTWDATNIKVYLDGALVATRAIGTNVVDEPLYLISYNTVSGETVWTECLYAYVAP
jgi:hypothetical protein